MSKETEDGRGAVAGRVERPVRPLSARLDVLRVLLATNHPEHYAAVAEAQAEIERLRAVIERAGSALAPGGLYEGVRSELVAALRA